MFPDDKIGRYRIVSKIGEGGMGEVYLADDAKLGRRVALKILPASVASDTDRMLRFEHEARSASALNHPNIITIYEINDEEGDLFIAMEYVDGQTLSKKIKSKDLDLRQALDIAIQIAAALAAAHEANVIHRDIKPDNIIVRPDGLVKVLDFGLAKLTEKAPVFDLEALTTLVKTSPGLIMGTVGYMSPEQARGRSVDGRSDIFSFGSMLYEMLSGKRPFTGDNEVDVIASIIHKEPETLAGFAPEIPYLLETIVLRTLRKNRDERYQNMPELLADLRDVRQELTAEIYSGRMHTHTNNLDSVKITGDRFARPMTTGGQSGFKTSTISEAIFDNVRLHPLIAAGIVLIAVAAIGFAGFKYYITPQRPDSFQTMRMSELTSTGNVASGQVAISPDGKYIAYAVQEAGKQSLWIKQTVTASNVQIIQPADVIYDGLTFSPDAAHIYYSVAEKNEQPSLYQIPALGGPSRKLIADAKGPITFSPDGSRIAFIRKETSVIVARSDGSAEQSIVSASAGKRWLYLAWSPDGENLAAIAFSAADSRDHLVEISVRDRSEKPIDSPEWQRLTGLAWIPTSGLIVSGRDLETDLSQLWLIGYPDGQTRRITNDLSSYLGLSVTADGNTIVSVQENTLSNIWLTPGADGATAQKLTTELGRDDGMSGISLAPDGRIVYTVRVRGTQDLWIMNGNGTRNHKVTFNSQSNYSPAFTPDGRYIVFASTRAGNPNIWRMDIDGSNALQLTDEPGIQLDPSVSPDGKWVVYQQVDSANKSTIWKVSIGGEQRVQLTNVRSRRPSISPDGKIFACSYAEEPPDSPFKIAIVPIDGGPPVRILDLPLVARSRTILWSADGKALIYADNKDQIDNLWSQSLEGGPPKQLTDLKSDRIFRFDMTRDGNHFAFARGNETSDAVMIGNYR